MKLCKDCKYFVWKLFEYDMCSHGDNRNPIDGSLEYRICRYERSYLSYYGNNCGPQAKNFEPKIKK